MAINFFPYFGLTDVDYSSAGNGFGFNSAVWFVAELPAGTPGFTPVTFSTPDSGPGTPWAVTNYTGVGTMFDNMAKVGWDMSVAPNYPTTSYTVSANGSSVDFTFHHAPDVGFPAYIPLGIELLTPKVLPGGLVQLSWNRIASPPDMSFVYRRTAFLVERREWMGGDSWRAWEDVTNFAMPLSGLTQTVGPFAPLFTPICQLRVLSIEPVPSISIYSPPVIVDPSTITPPTVTGKESWGIIAS